MTTVKSCQQAKKADGNLKEWNGKPIYEIILSDGVKGESFSSIPTGTPTEDLEVIPNENPKYPAKIKLIKKNGFTGGGFTKAKAGNESFALSYAKDIVVAMIPGLDPKPKAQDMAKVATMLADTFFEWLETKKK